MRKNINITTKLYLLLLHAIWAISMYYYVLFGFYPASSAQQQEAKLDVDEHGVSHIKVSIPFYRGICSNYKPHDMKVIINEWISVFFKTDYPELQPYTVEGTRVVEMLYLYNVEKTKSGYEFDYLVVDSPLAYRLYKSDIEGGVII